MVSQRGSMYRLCTAIILTLLLLPAPLSAAEPAATLRVGAGGEYATLAEALDAAQPGATVEVLPGVQTGQWTITVPLTLRGRAGAVLDGGGQGTLLTIAARGVTVEGLTIRNSGRSLLNDDTAILVTQSNARILRNHLEDIHHAIYVRDGAAQTRIRGNTIRGRAALIPEDRGNGIHLWDAPDTLVEHNVVEGVRDGVYVGFAPRSQFHHNQFRHVRYGIHFMYADDNVFADNVFEQSEAGAALMYSRNITLRRNIFAHSRSNRAYGLLLQECDNVLAEHNLLADNSRALFVNVSRNSLFRGNLFVANDLAVQIYAGSADNVFQGNDFSANLQLVELDRPGSNRWEGNYWEEYRGLDMNGDGYGDIPFATGDPLGTLTSDYPQVRLFRYSPAVQALEVAERAFPVLELPEIRDTRPALRPVAQASGQLPALPAPATGGPPVLIVFALLCLLGAVAIGWYAQRPGGVLNQSPHSASREPGSAVLSRQCGVGVTTCRPEAESRHD